MIEVVVRIRTHEPGSHPLVADEVDGAATVEIDKVDINVLVTVKNKITRKQEE